MELLQQGIEPVLPQGLKRRVITSGPPGKFLKLIFLTHNFTSSLVSSPLSKRCISLEHIATSSAGLSHLSDVNLNIPSHGTSLVVQWQRFHTPDAVAQV